MKKNKIFIKYNLNLKKIINKKIINKKKIKNKIKNISFNYFLKNP